MKILGLDSSAKAASVAILDDGEIIAYGGVNAKITHSETLLPLCESVLKAVKLTLGDMDAFAVTAGPGSFTGVRIAVSAVKGMAFALNKSVYAVSTLHALAYNLIGRDCVACPLMDARRGQYYNALFRISGDKVTRLTPDRAITEAELEAELSQYKAEKIIKTEVCEAAAVCRSALEYTPISAKELMPFYLRLPQAEREAASRRAHYAASRQTETGD